MELKDLTKDQLKAMGLTDEQIEAILGVSEGTGGGTQLPLALVKINYDSDFGKVGALAVNPQKEEREVVGYEKVYESPFKIRVLKSYYQYSKYDPNTNQTTVSSNIFTSLKDAKKAIDMKSNLLVKDLRESDDKIKMNRILVLEIDGDTIGVMFVKGAYLYELNQILAKFPNDGHLAVELELTHKKQKNGTVTYFTPELKDSSDHDFIKTIKEDSGAISAMDKWVKEYNSSLEGASSKPESQTSDDIDVDEDELEF